MKKLLLGLLLTMIPVLPVTAADTGISPDVRDAFESYIELPSILVPVLKKAQDKQSADAAAAELSAALPNIYTTRSKLHNIQSLTQEQSIAISSQYGQRMREEWARIYEEIERLRKARCHQSPEFLKAYRLMCMMIEK